MKRVLIFCTLLFVIFTSCGPSQHIATPDMDIKIRIDYREESTTRQMILQVLRWANPKDLVTTGDGNERTLEAVFPSVTPEKFELIEQIEQQVRRISGVFYVELMRPSRPVLDPVGNPAARWQ